MNRHEIIIAGGSLAGIAAAIRLKQLGFDPLVIDKAKYPRPKLCGEFLGPDAHRSLSQLGIQEQIEQAAWGPIHSAMFHLMGGQTLTIPMRWLNTEKPYGLGVCRNTLDLTLIRHARSLGITVLEEARILPEIQPTPERTGVNRFQLQIREAGASVLTGFSTRWLIDASGRHGGLYLSQSTPRASSRTMDKLGISLHISKPVALDPMMLSMFIFPGGYGGIQPLSKTVANVCMLISRQQAPAIRAPYEAFIHQTLAQHPVAQAMLAGSEPISDFRTTANLNLRLCTSPGHAELIRIGDARLTVEPVTGSGMALALETGILAAESLGHGIQSGWDYPQTCRHYNDLYQKRFGLRLALLERLHPFLFSPKSQQRLFPLLKPVLPVLAGILR